MIENLEKKFSRRHIEARLRLCVWSISEDCIDRLIFFSRNRFQMSRSRTSVSSFCLKMSVSSVIRSESQNGVHLVGSGVTPLTTNFGINI